MSYTGGCYVYTSHAHPMVAGRSVRFEEGVAQFDSRGQRLYCAEINSVISSHDGECRVAVETALLG